jgi:hypothetical protein
MFIVLAIVLAVLRAFTSQHYFLAGRNGLLWIRDRMVRGMDSEAKADESISRHDVWGDGPPWVQAVWKRLSSPQKLQRMGVVHVDVTV